MRTETITCDSCKANITTGPRWIVVVSSKPVWNKTDPINGPNPLPEDLEFCNLSCLKTWAEGNLP